MRLAAPSFQVREAFSVHRFLTSPNNELKNEEEIVANRRLT